MQLSAADGGVMPDCGTIQVRKINVLIVQVDNDTKCRWLNKITSKCRRSAAEPAKSHKEAVEMHAFRAAYLCSTHLGFFCGRW